MRVDGLFDGDVVRLVDTRPKFVRRGVAYCYVVRLSTRAALRESTAEENPTPGVPLGGVQGQVPDAAPDTNAAVVNLSSFNTLPED